MARGDRREVENKEKKEQQKEDEIMEDCRRRGDEEKKGRQEKTRGKEEGRDVRRARIREGRKNRGK